MQAYTSHSSIEYRIRIEVSGTGQGLSAMFSLKKEGAAERHPLGTSRKSLGRFLDPCRDPCHSSLSKTGTPGSNSRETPVFVTRSVTLEVSGFL